MAEPLAGSFAAKLPAGTHLLITDGHCACRVYPSRATTVDCDDDEERRRYQRKGWSRSKIERAINAKREAHARPSSRPDLAKCFVEAVQELTTSGARVTLLAHSFRGALDEPFEVAGVESTPLETFLKMFGKFPEDKLVTIVG
ncbi:MAG TPA: hypothetical protein VFS58_06025 [Steroidobacteraceae bacterium]|nr:hypothetical protein [Steroidobacteraceae bacterium]